MNSEVAAGLPRWFDTKGLDWPASSLASEQGFFYVVQLQPDEHPERVKLGWSKRPSERIWQIRQHYVAESAVLLGAWPCLKRWERVLICITTYGSCEPIPYFRECFVAEDVPAVVARAEEACHRHPVMQKPEDRPIDVYAYRLGLRLWMKELYQWRAITTEQHRMRRLLGIRWADDFHQRLGLPPAG